jgi:hypothetical protein
MDGTFLHSPLLDELKSLETMLVRKAYRQHRSEVKRNDGSTGSRQAVQEAPAKKPSCKVELPTQACILCRSVCSVVPFSGHRRAFNSATGSAALCWEPLPARPCCKCGPAQSATQRILAQDYNIRTSC